MDFILDRGRDHLSKVALAHTVIDDLKRGKSSGDLCVVNHHYEHRQLVIFWNWFNRK